MLDQEKEQHIDYAKAAYHDQDFKILKDVYLNQHRGGQYHNSIQESNKNEHSQDIKY